jgi:hypothetical protein
MGRRPRKLGKKSLLYRHSHNSLAEWQRFIGDALPYEKTCPDLPALGEEGWVSRMRAGEDTAFSMLESNHHAPKGKCYAS